MGAIIIDSMNQEIPSLEQQKLQHEQQKIDTLLDTYPDTDRIIGAEIGGLEVIVCGEMPNPDHIATLQNGYQQIAKKIGQETAEKIFRGTQVYLVNNANSGGGQALPRMNAIILETSKMDITVELMEEITAANGSYRKGDQSGIFGPDYNASELGFVHELGHILEFKAHGDMDLGFALLNPQDSPTWYGQQKPREDYAESWMFFVYDKPVSQDRTAVLAKDITQLS